MKKIGYALLAIITLIIVYGIIEEIRFTPLTKKDFKNLFPNYDGDIKLSYHKDFIGLSHGDFFDLYMYELNNISIDLEYPKFGKEWEYISLPDSVSTTKWLKCPIDSVIQSKYLNELTWITNNGTKEGEMLKQEIKDTDNYYCFIYVSELEKYFLLYSSSYNMMYYIRQRGF